MSDKIKMTHAEWEAEAKKRFGDDFMNWAFECPACKHVATVTDYKNAGAKTAAVAQECVGRYLGGRSAMYDEGPGPCDYAGYGLFRLSPIIVVHPDGVEQQVFAFAEPAAKENENA